MGDGTFWEVQFVGGGTNIAAADTHKLQQANKFSETKEI